MKRFRLPLTVFLLVFLCGILFVLWQRTQAKKKPAQPQPVRTEAVNRKLPPLKLPDEKPGAAGGNSWEYSGETMTNFVTAQAKFNSVLMHQGWHPDKRITLDESLSPQVLLTFRNGDLELILMLWKIDGNTTGFSYRREKIINPGADIQ